MIRIYMAQHFPHTRQKREKILNNQGLRRRVASSVPKALSREFFTFILIQINVCLLGYAIIHSWQRALAADSPNKVMLTS